MGQDVYGILLQSPLQNSKDVILETSSPRLGFALKDSFAGCAIEEGTRTPPKVKLATLKCKKRHPVTLPYCSTVFNLVWLVSTQDEFHILSRLARRKPRTGEQRLPPAYSETHVQKAPLVLHPSLPGALHFRVLVQDLNLSTRFRRIG